MGAMVEAYMAWSLSQKSMGGNGFFDSDKRCTRGEERRKCDNVHTMLFSVLVLDVFCEWTKRVACTDTHSIVGTEKTSITVEPTDLYLTSALVRHSLISCSPITPKVAITACALNLYHMACQRCPHLSIQAYVKSLCNIHGICQGFFSKILEH